ncbi:MAG: hypothetical protein Q9213_001722 [Squamulea squamosa]
MTYTLSSGSPSQPALPSSPSTSQTFTLHTPPQTDIWRKPQPLTNRFNAPRYLTTIPLKELKCVQVTVKGEWKTLYDQGGLLLVIPPPTAAVEESAEKQKWIKTGIEFYGGEPHISAVTCDRWADWSLLPLPSSGTSGITIGMEREVKPQTGEKTSTLWIRYLDSESKEWKPIREIAWGFENDDGAVQVGVYAAKPTPDLESEELNVEFTGLEIKRW